MKILAFIYKQWHLNVSSLSDLSWFFVYPYVGLLSLGMLSLHLKNQGVGNEFLYFVLVGTLCWDFLNLSQKATTFSILYDIWSDCLRYTFLAPINLREFVIGHGLFGLFAASISFTLTQVVAYLAFGFEVWRAGWVLVPSALSIWLFATAMGMAINGLVLRKGYGISFLAWTTVGVTMIFSGVYYPIDIFPDWLQTISNAIPVTHVIISLRGILLENTLLLDEIAKGFGLSVFYVFLAYAFLESSVRFSKKTARLSNW